MRNFGETLCLIFWNFFPNILFIVIGLAEVEVALKMI